MIRRSVVWMVAQAGLWCAVGVAATELYHSARDRVDDPLHAGDTADRLDTLGLGEDQQVRIRQILTEYEARVLSSHEQLWDEVRAIELWADRAIQDVLNDEQKRRYQELVAAEP